jgi:hypothetical protein
MIRRAARAAYSGSTARTAVPAGPRGGSDPRLHIPPPSRLPAPPPSAPVTQRRPAHAP